MLSGTQNSNIIREVSYYSHTYNIIAKIDYYDKEKRILVEKKNYIKKVYDGYIYQLYAQYYALKDNREEVLFLYLYDISNNMYIPVPLPENHAYYKNSFENILFQIKNFKLDKFYPTNKNKCKKCIYNNLCDRSLDDK